MIFDEDVRTTIQRAINNDDMDEDEVNLSKAARIVRKDIFSKSYDFTGSFKKNCEHNAVSKSLLTLIRMILQGPITENQKCHAKRDHISVAMTELLQFNTIMRSRSKDRIRHNKGERHHCHYILAC